MAMADAPQRKNEVLPNPDPSAITTEVIDKAIGQIEEKVAARIDGIQKAIDVFHADLTRVPTLLDRSILGLRELLETRLLCMENDIKAVHAYLDTRGKDISDQITHVRELVGSNINVVTGDIARLEAVSSERFARIDTQFIERDKRTDQLSLADKTAVAAALQAAKEAVGAQNTSNSIAIAKSESSTVESIRQLQALFNTANAAMNDKVNDVKSRLDKGEGRSSERDPAVTESLTRLMLKLDGLGKDMNGVHTMNAATTGHAGGKTEGIGLVGSIVLGSFAFIGAIGSIIAIVIAIKT